MEIKWRWLPSIYFIHEAPNSVDLMGRPARHLRDDLVNGSRMRLVIYI